jgi:riboflavin kinase/FMN adenylyltransferase
MEITYGLERFVAPPEGVVLTIGNFDGVHRGHAQLVSACKGVAARLHARVTVMTFHPHPLAVLAPERAPARLTTLAEKLVLLERLRVAHTIVLHSGPALLGQQAVDFLAALVTHCRPRAFVEGPDFNFGKGRTGSVATLQEHAAEWGYEVHLVGAVHCAELPTQPTISSSSIRQALRDGRIDEANLMLGRPHRIVGVTGSGAGRGRGLGFPTANLERIPQLLPQQAVYAALAQVAPAADSAAPGDPASGLRESSAEPLSPMSEPRDPASEPLYPAAVNIGPQPTFAGQVSRVEAHLLDFAGELRGRRVALYLLTRLREQRKFENANELARQIEKDIGATRETIRRRSDFALLPL